MLFIFILLAIGLILFFLNSNKKQQDKKPDSPAKNQQKPSKTVQQKTATKPKSLEVIKGEEGEQEFIQHYERTFSQPYILLNHCTFEDGLGGTTQIDHIILSPFGIFVVECKNYSGWIFGEERQKTWTQRLPNKSYQFQNPLHQNYKHIKVLEQILQDLIDPQILYPLVVFTEKSELKTDMPDNVLQGQAWAAYVKKYRQVVLHEHKLKKIHHCLQTERLPVCAETDERHIRYLQSKKVAS